MSYSVALCGLSAKDRHLVEVVVTRTPNPRHGFRILRHGAPDRADIAIVDAGNAAAEDQYRDCLGRNPALVAIDVSEQGLQGRSRYRIARGTLLMRVLRVLEEVVERELTGRDPPLESAAH